MLFYLRQVGKIGAMLEISQGNVLEFGSQAFAGVDVNLKELDRNFLITFDYQIQSTMACAHEVRLNGTVIIFQWNNVECKGSCKT